MCIIVVSYLCTYQVKQGEKVTDVSSAAIFQDNAEQKHLSFEVMSVMMDIIVLNIHFRSTIVLCTTSELFEKYSNQTRPDKSASDIKKGKWRSQVEFSANIMMKELCQRDEDLTCVDNLCLLVQFPSLNTTPDTTPHYALIYVKESSKCTACCCVCYL